MNEWTVHFEGHSPGIDEDVAETILEALVAYAPAVSFGHGHISITMTVQAATPQHAVERAAAALMRLVDNSALTRVEAERVA